MKKKFTLIHNLLYLFVFISKLSSTTFVFTRILVSDLDRTMLSFVRYGFTGVIFLSLLFIKFLRIKFGEIDLFFTSIFGIYMFTLLPISIAMGMELTTSSRSEFLCTAMPIFKIIINVCLK